jgi:hypothetical protein
MLFRSIALASILTLASATETKNDGGLVRMKLKKRSDHEMVSAHLQRENEALRLKIEGKDEAVMTSQRRP